MAQLAESLVKTTGNFDMQIEWAKKLFEISNVNDGTSDKNLKEYGGVRALFQKLQSSLKGGIEDTAEAKLKREAHFGSNALVEPPTSTLWEIFIGCFEDRMLQLLLIAAVASFIIGVITEGLAHGWYESVAILVAVGIVVSITTVNDYSQAQQFKKLFKKSQNRIVKVVRDGKLKEIDSQELLVGDVYEVNTGLIIPADSVLIERHADFVVDESQMTGESIPVKKTSEEHPVKGATCFLISGSKIVDGSGYAMVILVGTHSQIGIMRAGMETEDQDTPLQLKLTDLGELIGNIGMLGAGLTVAGCVLGLVMSCMSDPNRDLISLRSLNDLLGFIVLGITIIVMAVPEGLPMAVTIALAYSVEKMRQLNNLVRDMSACETMGNATDICSDKTGTLTENSMTVIDIYYGDNFIPVVNNINDRMKKDADLLELCTIASINSTATPDFSKSLRDQTGNKTELAILEFSKNLGVDYGRVRQLEKIVQMVPFSSERKKMLTIFQETPTSQVLYMKGAPEIVVEHCAYYKKDGKKYAIEKQWKDNLENNILRMIGEKKARAIAVAKVEVTGYKEGEDPANYERDMTFLGVFGIMDPVRQDVPPAVAIAQKAGITVRMVTGDNTQIGAAIAKECGILRKDWTPKEDDYSVMDGKTFREKVKDLQWREEDRGNGKKVKVPYVGDMLAFQRIEPQLKVIGRCQPTDKLLLVTGLQNMGKVVAVTGDGANDAPALKKADVGLGMGKTGTDICKDASKIVLLDDNFTSIVTAVKFGRNIFDAIRKFIKFQLTVNLTAMAIAIFCGFVIKESPINAIQMLWINVIMDSFSSLALATEPPTDELLTRPPTKKREHIITQTIWNAVCFQALCQFILLLIVLFYTPTWFGIPSTIHMEVYNEAEAVHFSYFFNVFVFLQMFNFINARVIKKTELNPFQNPCSNPIFWAVVALTFIGQVTFVQFGGRPVKCAPLPLHMHLSSLAFGSLSLVFAFIEKLIPDQYLPFPMLFKEKDEVDKDTITHGIMSAASMGIYRKNKSSIIR